MSKFHQHNIPRNARLTPDKVREIRQLYEQGLTQRELGKQFGVSAVQIGRIVRGESWGQFERPLTKAELDCAERNFESAEPIDLPPGLLDQAGDKLDNPIDAVDEFLKKRGEKPL